MKDKQKRKITNHWYVDYKICCTNLKGSKSEEVGRFIKQLLEASPDILRESLIHVMIEFLLIILTDGLKAIVIRHDKLFVPLARVRQLTKEMYTEGVKLRNVTLSMRQSNMSYRSFNLWRRELDTSVLYF
uniref:Uncharacterized protein n=1 Tax=Solanum lycopersicum TaxID=4081 RepID=K4C174_SOLLC